MKNLYKITKGQLISLWVFSVIGWFIALSESSYSGFATFLSVFIPMIIIFYTIGWKSSNKKDETEKALKVSNVDINKYLNKTLKVSVIILFILGVIFGVYKLLEIKKEKIRVEKLTQDYEQAILKIEPLKKQLLVCIQPALDKKYQEEERSCNLLKNKIKADYDFCVEYTSVSPRASCLYDHDYEKIDCSKETIAKKALSQLKESETPMCLNLLKEIEDANLIIEEYSKLEN